MAKRTHIKGLKELRKGFSTLSTRMQGKILGKALSFGAQPIVNKAKENAPFLTGTLRRSIGHNPAKVSRGRASVTLGPSVEYAPAVEFGREDQPRRRKQPYMVPAFRDKHKESIQEVRQVLGILVVKTMKQ